MKIQKVYKPFGEILDSHGYEYSGLLHILVFVGDYQRFVETNHFHFQGEFKAKMVAVLFFLETLVTIHGHTESHHNPGNMIDTKFQAQDPLNSSQQFLII